MTWEEIEGKWNQIAGLFDAKFPELDEKDTASLSGTKDQLSSALQKQYGYSKEEGERHLEIWRNSLSDDDAVPTSTSGAPTY